MKRDAFVVHEPEEADTSGEKEMTDHEAPDTNEGNPTEEAPDRTDETTEPSKGAGRKRDVQPRPEDQRGRPDPKEKDGLPGG